MVSDWVTADKETHTAVAVSVLLESPEVGSTRGKDTVGVEGLGLEVVETKVRRAPTTAAETAVEPLFGTVGCVRSGVAVATGAVLSVGVGERVSGPTHR